MSEYPIEGLMNTAMNSIKEMVDVNTIVGDPIQTSNNVVIIPISKVNFGFAAGGSEFNGKTTDASKKEEQPKDRLPFGGGSGAGVTINPIAFLVIQGENVKLMSVNYSSSIDKLLDYIPDLLDKTNNMINKCIQKSKDKTKGDTKENEQKKSEKVKMDKNRIAEDLDESKHIKERIERTKKPVEEEITYEYEYDETLDDDE